jgi:hypothetical protein
MVDSSFQRMTACMVDLVFVITRAEAKKEAKKAKTVGSSKEEEDAKSGGGVSKFLGSRFERTSSRYKLM